MTDEQQMWASKLDYFIECSEEGQVRVPRAMLVAFRALLSVSKPTVPQGWKLVPVEPTKKMIDEAQRYTWVAEEDATESGIWRHMLAASPQATVCTTCNGHGMIGGPSYYAPDEGGEPCPDCAPATQPAQTAQSGIDALFASVTDWMNTHRIPFEAQNELFRILAASLQPVAQTRALTFEDRQTAVEAWEERIIADGRNISSREAACFEDGFEACRALLAAQPAPGDKQ